MQRLYLLAFRKGGCGKTTVTAMTAHILSRDFKVLAVDFDSQGNLTQFLTQRNIYDFEGETVLEACKERDARPYIQRLTDNLHLLPAEDILAIFSRWIYTSGQKRPMHILKDTLESVEDEYDYILIDMPPNLGDHTLNGLTASDYAVVICQSEPFCYSALGRYLETTVLVKEKTNPRLQLAGILISMIDSRAKIDQKVAQKVKDEYEEFVFGPIIKRRSRIREFAATGITDATKADQEAIEPYEQFVKELKERVQTTRPIR